MLPLSRLTDHLAFLALSLIGDQMYTAQADDLYHSAGNGTSASVKGGPILAHDSLRTILIESLDPLV